MLRLFNSKHPLFPVRWANAVTSWLLGLCSNSGSITIQNTATPGRGDGPSIDVNLAWAKSLIASETPRPETERPTEDLVPPEKWETDDSTGAGQKQDTTGIDGETTVEAYPCCGKSILPAAADHQHKSNIAPLDKDVPEAYSEDGSIGTSTYAARLDHTHRFQTAKETATSDNSNVQSELDALNETLDTAKSTADAAQSTADAAQTAADAAQTDATDAKTKVDAVVTKVGETYKVPLSTLTGNIDGHSGTCLVTITDDGSLGHTNKSGADVNLLGAAADRKNANDGTTKLLTDGDISNEQIESLKKLDNVTEDDIGALSGLADWKDTAITTDNIADHVGTWVISKVVVVKDPAMLTLTFKNTMTNKSITSTVYTTA